MNTRHPLPLAAFWTRLILRGISQIFLQANAWTGAWFLAALAWVSLPMALAAVAGSFLGSLYAKWRRYPDQEVTDGLYGFNSALIAVAMVQVPRTSLLEMALVALATAAGIVGAAILARLARRREIPIFTAPFILVVWILLLPLIDLSLLPGFAEKPAETVMALHFTLAVVWSFGQVIFLNTTISGILVFVGLALSNWRTAVWAAGAALLASVIGGLAGWPHEFISQGLFGYNAVLTAIALMSLKWPWRVAGVCGSCLIMHAFLSLGWPALTAPFVLSSWLGLWFAHNFRSVGGGRSNA